MHIRSLSLSLGVALPPPFSRYGHSLLSCAGGALLFRGEKIIAGPPSREIPREKRYEKNRRSWRRRRPREIPRAFVREICANLFSGQTLVRGGKRSFLNLYASRHTSKGTEGETKRTEGRENVERFDGISGNSGCETTMSLH